jgi:hypothetical protein
MFDKNYYEILGVTPSASERNLKERFRKLMKLYHPDVNQSSDAVARYAEIMEAYRTLSDKSARAMYDLSCNFVGVSPLSDDSPPSETRKEPSSPRRETMEDRKDHYEKLLREKRAREQAEKKGSFTPYSYLARWRVWLVLLASSLAIAALSVYLEMASSPSAEGASVAGANAASVLIGIGRIAFVLVLLMWLVYLCLRAFIAYVDCQPSKAIFWLWGLVYAYLYDIALARFCGAAGYGDSLFIKIGNVAFLPGLFVFFVFFTFGILFLEKKQQITQVQYRMDDKVRGGPKSPRPPRPGAAGRTARR